MSGYYYSNLKSIIGPKTFWFQFWTALLTLFSLTKLSSTVGNSVTTIGTALVLLFVSWKFTKWLRRIYFQERLDSGKKAVLVTGCDTGFGHRLANRLNRAGYTVYAACMDPGGNGPQQLLKTAVFPKETKLIQMDVTSQADVDRALEEVKDLLQEVSSSGVKLWAIVNNAGISRAGYVEWGKLEDFQKVLDVNTIGMVRVTRAFLPFVREAKGRVVNVASMGGRIAVPGIAMYSMSKHAVVAFSAVLRREMLPWGVKVSTIEPSFYKTALTDVKTMQDGARKTWEESTDSTRNDYGEKYFETFLPGLDVRWTTRDNPEEVVDAMYDAISHVEPQIAYRVCGLLNTIFWWANDYLPDSILDFLFKLICPKCLPKADN